MKTNAKNNNSQTYTDTGALAESVINGKQRHFDHMGIESSWLMGNRGILIVWKLNQVKW